jgi:hypothetical protein
VRQSLGGRLGGRVKLTDLRHDQLVARIEELERLNREYTERAIRAEDEIARMRVNRSRFGEYLHRLDEVCTTKLGMLPAQCFRRDPVLGGSNEMSWAAWLADDEEHRVYGRSGEDALKALVHALEGSEP